MKLSNLLLVYTATFGMLLTVNAHAENQLSICSAKEQNIQQQIAYAKQYGNHQRVLGLERALVKARANCTDEKLTQQQEKNIAKKQRKVTERMAELNQAKATGRQDKIDKKEKKLQEAQLELHEAQNKLHQ